MWQRCKHAWLMMEERAARRYPESQEVCDCKRAFEESIQPFAKRNGEILPGNDVSEPGTMKS